MTVAQQLKSYLVIKPSQTVGVIAKQLDMSRPAFSNVINGNADLSIELALKIEAAFDLDAREMLIAQLDEKLAEAKKVRK